LIDSGRLRHLRLDRGLTQRKLAAACGVDPLTIHRLEHDGDAGDLPLRVVQQLATALGTDFNDLLDVPANSATEGDIVRRLGTALFSQHHVADTELADALGITLEVLNGGLAALAAAASTVGMTLLRNDGRTWLAPQQDQAAPTAPARSLTTAEARLLRRIHRGVDVRRGMTRTERQTVLPALLRLGILEATDTGLRLVGPAAAALLPHSERPPAAWRHAVAP
jgi:transcriptional regulator with XRE-family HTH domain